MKRSAVNQNMAAVYLWRRNTVLCRHFMLVVRMVIISVPIAVLILSLQNLTHLSEEAQLANLSVPVNDRLQQIVADEFPVQTDVQFEEYQLDVARSNAVPLDRSPPDVRPPICRQLSYDIDALPDVSVIVPVFDESWSMLLRALHGLVARTPDRLLREIIIVDDFSSRAYLKRPLDQYTAVLSPKIRVIRNVRREGLVRSRLTAARVAIGEVLVFLDAHVEVNYDWLLPLLDVIRRNRSRLAVPRIDSIDAHTLEYEAWEYTALGSLTWTLDYIWKLAPSTSNADYETELTATATTIGCAVAVDRRFFFDLGAFDEGMLIWGGENLELSIRAWTCAGGVYISPCSRVAHLFRQMLPYRVPTDRDGCSLKLRNYRRLVDVWFDDYRKYYYATERRLSRSPSVIASADPDADEFPSIEARRRLRQKLHCRSFQWYLENVARDLIVPEVDSRHFGQLQNVHGRICATNTPGDDSVLPMTECGWRNRSQIFSLMQNGTVVQNRDRKCLTATVDGYVFLRACSDADQSQMWTYNTVAADWNSGEISDTVISSVEAVDALKPIGKLSSAVKQNETMCLTQVTSYNGQQVLSLLPCRGVGEVTELFQYWLFTYSLDWNRVTQ